ncbi:O-antigen polysaccharide polymerase Wzy [Elizabethkingia meningoseptica]|uniref:O-antigen polysaccharide polymerase Wzy n=1 Tax=Elizabethkingia meningoseptica TaxID=238 RepID=UPI0023AFEC4F|nr:O-antigen polysaccharide polymerase Wzy [Elizabethkingia meningoseptica]MDE5493014.1 O-antigen polysaccharide polymerase Wzy family protein [Elizabethkingia meningoseptica]
MLRYKNIFFLCFFFLLVIEGVYIFSQQEANKESSLLLVIQLSIVYFGSLFFSIKEKGIGGTFTLFLLCLGLFNFQKFFWDWFLNEDFRIAYSLIKINLEEIVVQKTLYIYCLFTLIVSFSYFYLSNTSKFKAKIKNNISINLQPDKKLLRVGIIIFSITVPLVAYKSYLEFFALFGKSYTEFYTEEGAVDSPFYLRLAFLFFQVGYMMILSSIPPIKKFYVVNAVYLLVLVPYLFLGLRATFAISILCIFWYYFNVYKKRIRFIRIMPILLIILFALQMVSINRSNSHQKVDYFKLLPAFLYEQSQSMYVLGLYIQYNDEIIPHKLPFIVDPIVSWLYPSGQSVEVVKSRSSLGHTLTYSLSPSYYLAGSSLGTNFIAELYEYGIFAIIIGAIVFAYFITYFDWRIQNSRLGLFLSLLFLQFFFLAPRSSFLPNFYFIFRVILVYVLLLMIFKLYNNKYLK